MSRSRKPASDECVLCNERPRRLFQQMCRECWRGFIWEYEESEDEAQLKAAQDAMIYFKERAS